MYNHVDCQAARLVEDHFCQTWSLLIAVELSQRKPAKTKETRKGRRIIDDDDDTGGEEFVFCPSGPGLNYILRFLQKILSIDTIAEGAYDEIYHRTHDTDGQQHYGAAINNTFILLMTARSHHIVCFQEIYFGAVGHCGGWTCIVLPAWGNLLRYGIHFPARLPRLLGLRATRIILLI